MKKSGFGVRILYIKFHIINSEQSEASSSFKLCLFLLKLILTKRLDSIVIYINPYFDRNFDKNGTCKM